jgi:hypothetical protein
VREQYGADRIVTGVGYCIPPAVLSYVHTLPVPLVFVEVPVSAEPALLIRMVTFFDLRNPVSLVSQLAFLQFT